MDAQSVPDADAAQWFLGHDRDVFIVIQAGRVHGVNPAWAVLTGHAASEVVGQPLERFCHPDDIAHLTARLAALAPEEMADIEVRLARGDQDWLWTRGCAGRMGRGDLVLRLRDVTGEKQWETEGLLGRRANDLLRETARITVLRYDPDFDRFELNPDFQRPYGARAEGDVPALRPVEGERDAVDPEDLPALAQAWERAVETGEASLVSYRKRRPGGGWAHLRTAWRGIRRKPSGKWEIIGVTQDLSELAEARDAAVLGEQAAQAAAEAKSQFIANISHEIRTPLNGVLGVLHLLKGEPLSAEGGRMLAEALSCGQMLSQLLNDVIDFSRIDAGRLELAPEPMCLTSAVEGVTSLLRGEAAAKGLELRAVAPADAGWIVADPARLRQVMFNLIGNGVKFTQAGHVEARWALLGAGAAQRLRLEVEDTGVGVPVDARDRLFDRFSQADNSSTRRFGGCGLGLAITRRLVELMGGAIGFTSRVGEGSTFWIEVPAPATDAPAQAEAGGRPLDGLRVLVVEDNAVNRMIATKMLESLGAAVETADDGRQGVDAVRRQRFDLIFMDIQMPVMDGVAATRAIRRLPGPAARTPILAMTANTSAQHLAAYRDARMDGLVAKPVSPSALVLELSRLRAAPAAETSRRRRA